MDNYCKHCGGELNTAYRCVKCGKDNQPIRTDSTAAGNGLPNKHNEMTENVPTDKEYDGYDSGLLNDYGRGNVQWWQDYIRAEVARCNDHWRMILETTEEDINK